MNPQAYREVSSKLKSTHAVRQRFIRRFTHPIKEALINEGYVFEIKARTKSISSIWRKMKSKQVPFEEVFDLFAIRIILDTPEELDRKSTRLNSSHVRISYAVFCLKKKI